MKKLITKFLFAYFFLTLLVFKQNAFAQAWLNFTQPDTLCLSDSLHVQNASPTGKQYYWNFSSAASSPAAPAVAALENYSGPGGACTVEDSGIFYSFITGYSSNNVTIVNYGSSYLNTPVSVTTLVTGVGNGTGSLSPIEVKKDGNNWVAITINTSTTASSNISRIDLGPSLKNPTHVVTSFGNIGNMSYPQVMKIIKDRGKWFGFVSNRSGNSVTRLDFGASLENTPTGISYSLPSHVDCPSGIFIRQNELTGHYILFLSSIFDYGTYGGSGFISRFDLGDSISAAPVFMDNFTPYPSGQELRDITIVPTCGGYYGIVIYRQNKMASFNFQNNDITSAYTNITNVTGYTMRSSLITESFPIDTLASSRGVFLVDYDNNSLELFKFPGNPAVVPGSNTYNAAPFVFPGTGAYTTTLVGDIGTPTESILCKQVTVTGSASLKVTPDTTVCSGSQLQLNATGGSNYSWTPTVGLSCTNCANPVASPLIAQTYTVIASPGTACSAQATVKVGIAPALNLTVSRDTSVCSGSKVQLVVSGGTTYSWLPADSLNCTNCANPVASPITSTTYTVSGSNGTCSNSKTVTVGVGNAAVAGIITAVRDTICVGTPGNLILSGNSSDVIQWQSATTPGSYSNTGPDTSRFKTNPLSQSTYYRAIVGSGNCIDTTTPPFLLFVPPVLAANFNYTESGSTVSFKDSSFGSIISYNWDFGDGTTSKEKNPAHTYPNTDSTYYVCLTIYDGSNCSYTFCRYVSVLTGIAVVSAEGKWIIYPNPFNNELIIDGKELNRKVQGITLYDVLGRTVLNKVSGALSNPLKLDVSGIAKGLYLLKIEADNTSYIQRIIKQ